LPKIHKLGYPLRIIISLSGNLLHNLASFLHNILRLSLPLPFSHINNSLDPKNELSDLYLTTGFARCDF